jgi:hypothetical protein
MGELRRRDFENQTLPEDEKFETTFTLYNYSSSHLLLEVGHKIRGQKSLERPRKSVIRPRHSGIMFLSPGPFPITIIKFKDLKMAKPQQKVAGPSLPSFLPNRGSQPKSSAERAP